MKKQKTEKSKTWLWILIAVIAIIALILVLLFHGCNKEDKKITEVEEIIVIDTMYIQEIEEIEDNYNAAEFKAGSAELPEAAKFVLHDLAKVLEKHPEVKLRIEGHTWAGINKDFYYQQLSEERAQAAMDFLVNVLGIDENRLEAVGLGSTQPKYADNPEAPENNRTEFVIIEEE